MTTADQVVSCLNLFPLRPCHTIRSKKTALSLLKLQGVIIEGIINSQQAFFKTQSQLFANVHKKKDCCQIKAVFLLLSETRLTKTRLELAHQAAYYANIQEKINQKIISLTENKWVDKAPSLLDFLKKNELLFSIGLIDQFIFVAYFLSHYKKIKYVTGKRKLKKYYDQKIIALSDEVIRHFSSIIVSQKKTEESLRAAKKEAIAANHAKTEFLENMRHDIRTPLTGIIGFARLIQKEADNSTIKNYADNLVLATTALLDFQNNILSAIKANHDIKKQINETFSLNALVERVLNLVRPKAIIKNLTLVSSLDDALPPFVSGDAKRLSCILLELVTNALKFTATGVINLTLKAEKMQCDHFTLVCEVSDTGIGIPDDKKEDIFLQFGRLSPSSDGVYEGTGLGLSTIKKSIKELGGRIVVKSNVNHGTTFIFSIPLMIPKKIPNAALIVEDNPVQFKNPSILVIEDHEMTATVTKLMLMELGCAVDVAQDAVSALHCIEQRTYALVLMDLGLPDSNGFLLSEEILKKTAHKKCPVIIALTAHKEEGGETRCNASGIKDIFQKPLLKSTAIKMLNTYLVDNLMQLPIFDLELGAKRIQKDVHAAKSMLELLIKNIDVDKKNIETHLAEKSWSKLHDVNHKLIGGLMYCGAPKLESCCSALHIALKSRDDKHITACAHNVLREIQMLRTTLMQ